MGSALPFPLKIAWAPFIGKQAGAELGQAQVKLEVVDEVWAKAYLKFQL